MEQTETLLQRIEAPRLPRLEQTGERHVCLAALIAAGAPADLASNHQRTQAPLGQIVVGRHVRLARKDEQLVLMPQQALCQRLTGMPLGLDELLTQGVD